MSQSIDRSIGLSQQYSDLTARRQQRDQADDNDGLVKKDGVYFSDFPCLPPLIVDCPTLLGRYSSRFQLPRTLLARNGRSYGRLSTTVPTNGYSVGIQDVIEELLKSEDGRKRSME